MGTQAHWDYVAGLRSTTMRQGLDTAALRGLEIGPLAHPIVRREDGDITYVDRADAETLRRSLAGDPSFDPARVVAVDVVWDGRKLRECVGGRRFDYVIASHVAEHVPDLIGFLLEIRDVLEPGGELRLAMPDHRYSHDCLREETRLTDLLAAWVLQAKRPQVRDVLDFRLNNASSVDVFDLLHHRVDKRAITPDLPFETAVQAARWLLEDPALYLDVHVWVLRPGLFARLMEQIAAHGLLGYACSALIDTAPPTLDFYAYLRPSDDRAAIRQSWQEAMAGIAEA